jgi:DNA mismatch repair protein MutS
VNCSPDSLKVDLKEKSLVVKGPKSLIETLKRSGSLPPGCTATVQKSASYLESTELDQFFGLLQRYRASLAAQHSKVLIEIGYSLSKKILDSWLVVSEWVSRMDVGLTLAKVAVELGYVKPTLIEGDEGSLQIKGLRHPLLELQDRKVQYVQHDISLGCSNDGNQGWLLYGLNASGKSSLMRATGLAVLLAQAGSFVPAQSMTLCPFSSLHTRIINTDNLWMGLSSFAVEMSEMRDIFQSAGPKSLVLGDELCSGTETTSATALVAAGLNGLLKRGARFLFATHLHGLNQISEVATNLLLQIWHLHVEYDQINDRLVYHRTLKKGSGSSLYGLEVAKAMRIPSDILEDAVRFRKQIAGEADIQKSVGSSWNSQIIRRTCEKCGAKEADDLEVHHIKPRAASIGGRLSDGSSVHSAANLIVLCDVCHDALHRDEFVVGPLVQTSDGLERSTAMSISSAKLVKSKWSEEDLQTIQTESKKYSHLTVPNLVKYLKNQHNISISAACLRKMIAGN